MARQGAIIRTADICDDHGDARVCELQFRDFAAREHFHGEVVTFATFEDNKGILDVLRTGGAGKV
ncbi:MAG: S-adenosylmethionine--2-demethylmenaquinone methyltransferase, partial [Gammaproteobacteria bacterium]|nr:S-adenosylmethionine--2-demethylmenaquinone methyltransferase [Gammaproteobacteria bacterium]